MSTHNKNWRGRELSLVTLALVTAILTSWAATSPAYAKGVIRKSTLPDLSGLAWVEDDLFIGVHDAKRNSEEARWPRVSLVRLPKSGNEGVTWRSLDLRFPGSGGSSNDLESVSRIPGGHGFLLAESGQGGEGARRIFFAVYRDHKLEIRSQVPWPVPVENVEAIEVGQVGQQLIFLYAERAEGLAATKLRWATLSLNPFEFGEFREVAYHGEDPIGENARPIVALAIDAEALIYSVSAYDPGDDDGPFRSVVWQIGKLTAGEDGQPLVKLGETKRVATLDGLKVESIAIRESGKGGKKVYVGTDDEHYGGIIRLLPGIP